MEPEKTIEGLLERARVDDEVYAVVLFGSYARGESYRDVDIALLVEEAVDSFEKRLEYQPVDERFDVQVFNSLPIYIRKEIVEEGKILYCGDRGRLYDVYLRTIQEFDAFKPIYDDYLRAVLHDGGRVDRTRVLTKLDQLTGYYQELNEVFPTDYAEYENTVVKRAVERLIQLLVETCIDICHLIAKGENLGLPSNEEDIFDKVDEAEIISHELIVKLREMRKFRNLLVHRYGTVDDQRAHENIRDNKEDFPRFKEEVREYLQALE